MPEDYQADLQQIFPHGQLDQRLARDQWSAYIYLVEWGVLRFSFSQPCTCKLIWATPVMSNMSDDYNPTSVQIMTKSCTAQGPQSQSNRRLDSSQWEQFIVVWGEAEHAESDRRPPLLFWLSFHWIKWVLVRLEVLKCQQDHLSFIVNG